MKRFSKTRVLPWPKVISDLADLEIDFLRKFLDMVNTQRNKGIEELEERVEEVKKEDFRTKQDYEQYVDTFSDDSWLINEADNQAEQLSIVGLYRIVELSTKKIISWPYHGDKDKIEACYRWKALKKNLKKDFGFDLSNVVSYTTIDELHCLNNDIKHKGTAGVELAKFSGWKKGEKIRNLRPHFDRFVVHIPKYLADFTEKLNDKLA